VLCDPKNHERVRARGEDPEELIDDYVAVISDAVRDCPDDMTVCVHLCKGNLAHGQGSGGYDDIAERLFNMPRVNGYFLEYDDERAGGFAPLRHLPKDRVAVLGIVTSKFPELESLDMVQRRVDEAAQYADIGQLCLSPQCGFASVYQTDRMTVDDQERKLANMVEIADRIWN
jgi:5-methyltetrahydropteroyltriglutamate--homocysteine methyltransferase